MPDKPPLAPDNATPRTVRLSSWSPPRGGRHRTVPTAAQWASSHMPPWRTRPRSPRSSQPVAIRSSPRRTCRRSSLRRRMTTPSGFGGRRGNGWSVRSGRGRRGGSGRRRRAATAAQTTTGRCCNSGRANVTPRPPASPPSSARSGPPLGDWVRFRTETPRRALVFEGMPRFFLRVREGDQVTEDPDGSEFPDLRTARTEAVLASFEITAEDLRAGKTPGARRFEIRDEAGRMLLTVPFPAVSNSP